MKCINSNEELEIDDNFCPKCGNSTPHGYRYFQDNQNRKILKDEYIVCFEPVYTFVNNNSNINEFNRVNKTQILLNSYYFLNKYIVSSGLKTITKDNWYPDEAIFKSLIAHELGHYITFVSLLK